MNAFKIVEDLEEAVAYYTSAPMCVAVNSCTNALFLCLKWHYQNPPNNEFIDQVEIPKRTYVSVPQQIIHAGFTPIFRNEKWKGCYQLKPYRIWDAARRFTQGMYNKPPIYNKDYANDFVCVSFHWSKILGIQQGGAILHNDPEFDDWARRARFDGRNAGIVPKDDKFDQLGWHMYMSPEIAAEGLVRLMHLPSINKDLPNDDYPDLSKIDWSNLR